MMNKPAPELWSAIAITPSKEATDAQLKAFREEFDEYWLAKNEAEKLDALADMRQVLDCLRVASDGAYPTNDENNDYLSCEDSYLNNGGEMGKIIAKINAVTKSNFSKFCRSTTTADMSILKYEKMGIKANWRKSGDYYVIYCTEDVKIDGKLFFKGKILKGIDYKEPEHYEDAGAN
jgi:hypothetical protein